MAPKELSKRVPNTHLYFHFRRSYSTVALRITEYVIPPPNHSPTAAFVLPSYFQSAFPKDEINRAPYHPRTRHSSRAHDRAS